jgi:uracil-DNA glycosylase family 4
VTTIYNSKCRDCELFKSTSNVCIPGDGSHDAPVIIVGEAPGAGEEKTGKPFMGKSGQLLRAELLKVGLTNVFITNTVHCRPPKNRAPTPTELKACRKYLDAEIDEIKPKAILTLGAVAMKAITKRAGITENHGRITEKDDVIHMATFHPAYALRDPTKLPFIQQDLDRFARYLKGERRSATVHWDIVRRENLRKFVADLQRCTEFSFDLETSGLKWYQPAGRWIRCVGLGLGFEDGSDFGWVIPIDMPGSPFHNERLQREVMDIVFEALEGKPACAHNGKFDNLWLWKVLRRKFYLNFDTMLAKHTIDENTPNDLKSLVRSILDEPDYNIDIESKKGSGSPRLLYEYNARDAVYTLRLKRHFMSIFAKDYSLRRLFFRLIMPAARAFEDIDGNGLHVNLERMIKTEKENAENLAQELRELNVMAREFTKREINWNSPAQVAELLYKDIGIECTVLTDGGAPSTGEEALIAIKSQHPIADKLVRYRELEKFRSTYLDGWKEFMVESRLYLSTKLHGTVTGRYSNRLHQVPRDGTIRNLIEAPPGWKFVQADLSQAEMRVAAIMSGDAELITCYKRGVDVHWRTLMETVGSNPDGEYVRPAIDTAYKILKERNPTARRPGLTDALEVVFKIGPDAGIELWKGWKEARKKAKAVNFGFLFGMMEKKFIETATLKYGFTPTFEEAERSRETFFRLYPGLLKWHEKQRRLVKLNGFVRNFAGRVRRLPGIYSDEWSVKSECERQAINSPVQGYIGDHKAMAVIEIHETFDRNKELRIVGEVHDAILMWVRIGKEDLVLPRVASIMRTPKLLREFKINLSVPLEADLTVGPWGDGKAYRIQS